MKARTRFLKMYYKLPEASTRNLVFDAYGSRPMTLTVIFSEVRNSTRLGDNLLAALGYKDDEVKK